MRKKALFRTHGWETRTLTHLRYASPPDGQARAKHSCSHQSRALSAQICTHSGDWSLPATLGAGWQRSGATATAQTHADATKPLVLVCRPPSVRTDWGLWTLRFQPIKVSLCDACGNSTGGASTWWILVWRCFGRWWRWGLEGLGTFGLGRT